MTSILALAVLALLFAWREWVALQERREWRDERTELLNRVKPETAQPTRTMLEAVPPPDPEPQAVFLDEAGRPVDPAVA